MTKETAIIVGDRKAGAIAITLAVAFVLLEKPVILRKKNSIFRLQCDQHEFMQAFFLPVKNPYYAVVNDDGTFELKDVPAGKRTVVAWHPFAGQMEIEVEVPEDGTVQSTLAIRK
jgi:hypothetical protein